jgi:hypothetical protein
MQRKDRIMSWLRETPPAQLAGHPVTEVIDHWDEARFGPLVSESERLPRNVVQLHTGRFVITVRPSGTEPKLKFYCQLLPDPAQRPGDGPRGQALLQAVRREADAAAQAIYNDLLAPLGVKLGPLGLALTDLIELDRKQEFERDTVPRLQQALAKREIADQPQLEAWLRREAAALLPGADPLPALRGPLGVAAAEWSRELPDAPGVKALVSFTGGGQG